MAPAVAIKNEPLVKGQLPPLAEGVGFEPTTPVSQGKRLAGARTRPLCDPSSIVCSQYLDNFITFGYIL